MRGMRIARLLALAGLALMAGIIVFGFVRGEFWKELRALVAMPWGVVTLVDIYVGFSLFCAWILFRERSRAAAAIWILLVLTWGNLVTCGYVLLALARCGGDWGAFWLGHRAARPRREEDSAGRSADARPAETRPAAQP